MSNFTGKSDENITKTLKKKSDHYWGEYGKHIEKTYGSAHYFEALKDDRFVKTGWREGKYIPKKKETKAGPGPTPPTPSPDRKPGKTAGEATGMGQAGKDSKREKNIPTTGKKDKGTKS